MTPKPLSPKKNTTAMNKLTELLSSEEKEQSRAMLSNMASSIITDNNRIAKAIAVYIRNKIEDFHVKYLSDDQMRVLNPLIRNAIYSFLIDFGEGYKKIILPANEKKIVDYVISNTIPYLSSQKLAPIAITSYKRLIKSEIGLPLTDLSNGGQLLAGYEWLYVPDYWEDCVYNPELKDIKK